MLARVVPVLRVLSVCALLSLTSSFASFSEPQPPGAWVRQDTALSASYLQVPAGCAASSCPLVVVSHPRGQTAERMRDSAQLRGLTAPLLARNFAVLLSADAGPTSWGSPAALADTALAHGTAVGSFAWNGRTYALGLSMGGLLALRSALRDAPYTVSGVILIDPWVSLRAAWDSDLTRRAEIEAAYGVSGTPDPALDPLEMLRIALPPPLLIASSPDDTTVSARLNAARLIANAPTDLLDIVPLRGQHLGANRFTPELTGRVVAFLHRLEELAALR